MSRLASTCEEGIFAASIEAAYLAHTLPGLRLLPRRDMVMITDTKRDRLVEHAGPAERSMEGLWAKPLSHLIS